MTIDSEIVECSLTCRLLGDDVFAYAKGRRGKVEIPITTLAERSYLKVEAVKQDYSFYYVTAAEAWEPLMENADGRILSTDVAGGFVGAYIGMYASSNGQPGGNVADLDWFEYVGLTD